MRHSRETTRAGLWAGVWCLAVVAALALPATAQSPDLVLRGGLVVDPESGTHAIRDVAIKEGRIVAVAEALPAGPTELDVTGLVVAPGFVDLHTHSPTALGQYHQVMNGVTTALELEAGAYPLDGFAEGVRDKAAIHYGASVGYGSIRIEAKLGVRQAHLLAGSPRPVSVRGLWTVLRSLLQSPTEAFTELATPSERSQMRRMLHRGLDEGGLGIGVPLDYFSEAVDRAELKMVFEVAADRGVPLFIHVRRGINGDPAGLREAIGLAAETGASIHVCHISHNAMRNTSLFLGEIREARAAGVDVTTEVLPYNAGSALISSAVFGRDWRTIFGIDYGDVEWAATGERFTEAMWKTYREQYPEGQVIHHYVDEAWTRTALAEPGVMVVSDLLPMVDTAHKVAPHNGAFPKVLGRYVREAGLLGLDEALAKMTLLPARRLEEAFPAFARKGRIRAGADADLVVFDPARILDQATYRDPFQPAVGIVHVLVAGEAVVRDGQRMDEVFPGQLLLGK